jgi:hypothetical protein
MNFSSLQQKEVKNQLLDLVLKKTLLKRILKEKNNIEEALFMKRNSPGTFQ